jgi:hypothetical protein
MNRSTQQIPSNNKACHDCFQKQFKLRKTSKINKEKEHQEPHPPTT